MSMEGQWRTNDQRGEELHTIVKAGDMVKLHQLLTEAIQGNLTNVVEFKRNETTPLHVAILKGDANIVEMLIKVGHADIHARSKEGDTPLHVAAEYGHEEIVKILLQQGAISDIMVENDMKHGDTPLHRAALHGHNAVFEVILSKSPNRQACLYAKDKTLKTPLHYAAGSGNATIVDMLLTSEGESLKMACDAAGHLPFHFAARDGDVQSLEKLAPEDIDVASNEGFTALHYAAWYVNVQAVRWLMQRGASVKPNKHKKNTPLHLAAICSTPSNDMVANIIVAEAPHSWKMANSDGKLAIGLADEHNNGRVVRAILRTLRLKGLPDAFDILTCKHKPNNTTLLHYAAGHGMEGDINWLTFENENGIETQDALGRTPLHWAALKGNRDTLKAIAMAGANLTKLSGVTKDGAAAGETPLFLALGEGHMEFVEELLSCGQMGKYKWMEGVGNWMMSYYQKKVEERMRNELHNRFRYHTKKHLAGTMHDMFEEIPPLYLALHAHRLDMAQVFQRLSSSSGEDAVNRKGAATGKTPLHWAVLLGRPDIVDQLCSKTLEFTEKMRPFEEDNDGLQPIEYATELNMQDVEAKLLKHEGQEGYIKRLHQERQIYVDSTNAILVVATLIASVTFAGWLQHLLPYDGLETYVATNQRRGIRAFWFFTALSFFMAIGAIQAGAYGVLPRRHVNIGRAVIYIRRALMVASLLMAISVVCVLGAFGAAGFVILPTTSKYEVYMASIIVLGGLINIGFILWFIQNDIVAPFHKQKWGRRLRSFPITST